MNSIIDFFSLRFFAGHAPRAPTSKYFKCGNFGVQNWRHDLDIIRPEK